MNANANTNETSKTNTKKNILEMPESALNEVNGGEFIDRVGPIYYHRNCGGRITTNTNFSGPRTPISYRCTVCDEEHSKLDQFDWYKTKRNQGGNPEY